MASVATFGPGDPVTNPGWFAVSNSNRNMSFTNNTSMWCSSKYCNPAMGDTLVGGDKQPLIYVCDAQLVYLNCGTRLLSLEDIALARSEEC